MEQYGLTLDYFKNLRFLGETTSLVYFGIFAITFFLTGGLIPYLLATSAAIIISIIIQRFVLNVRQPYPQSTAVIITGCSSGIGFDSALRFAKAGVVVYATVRKQADADHLLASRLPDTKGMFIVAKNENK